MDAFILLADGTRLDGVLAGEATAATGWIAANTAVVGFQEMVTDPAYAGRLLAFTYPEVGNVGHTERFAESERVQPAGVVVKALSGVHSHWRAEGPFVSMLEEGGVPCLCGADTRGLAVHLREHGEMAAAIAPADADEDELLATLRAMERPEYAAPAGLGGATAGLATPGDGQDGPALAVIDLGARASLMAQLAAVARVEPCAWDATADEVLATDAAGVFVTDGPDGCMPPAATVATLQALAGRLPVMACGLGHVALGVALGAEAVALKRGHHGVNYPVRSADGASEITQQRHSVVLDAASVEAADGVEITWRHLNDGTVEGIRGADGTATGRQCLLAPPRPDAVNPHIQAFAGALAAR